MPRTKSVPAYKLHKPSGQARVIIDGKHHYLGEFGSDKSKEKYARLLAENAIAPTPKSYPKPIVEAITVKELAASYWLHCETYYRDPDGKPSSELASVRQAMRPVKELYASLAVAEFSPLKLKAVRQSMIDKKLARKNINKTVDRIRRMFRWGVENEIVPPAIYHGLKAVAGLRAGRSEAKETAPIKPVPIAYVNAVLPLVSPTIAAVIRLQLLTGARPGEILAMRGCDIDTTGKIWTYRPRLHKTAWHGHVREIYLGPEAQKIVKPFLTLDTQAYLFNPRASREQYLAEKRASRKTPMTPSQAKRKRKANPKRPPGKQYSVQTYGSIIRKACVKANVPHWHPHQLRHNRATELRKSHGLEVARIILGHKSMGITEVYAEADKTRAIEVMGIVG